MAKIPKTEAGCRDTRTPDRSLLLTFVSFYPIRERNLLLNPFRVSFSGVRNIVGKSCRRHAPESIGVRHP
jgi:hypothetical protein